MYVIIYQIKSNQIKSNQIWLLGMSYYHTNIIEMTLLILKCYVGNYDSYRFSVICIECDFL